MEKIIGNVCSTIRAKDIKTKKDSPKNAVADTNAGEKDCSPVEFDEKISFKGDGMPKEFTLPVYSNSQVVTTRTESSRNANAPTTSDTSLLFEEPQ